MSLLSEINFLLRLLSGRQMFPGVVIRLAVNNEGWRAHLSDEATKPDSKRDKNHINGEIIRLETECENV